jgi:hypothetical protein
MKISQSLCRTDTDLEPLFPRKRRIIGVVQMITEGSIGHIIINKDHLCAIVTISNQRNEMEVAKLGEHLDFSLELVGSLVGNQVSTA